jgi:hypothetical protein
MTVERNTVKTDTLLFKETGFTTLADRMSGWAVIDGEKRSVLLLFPDPEEKSSGRNSPFHNIRRNPEKSWQTTKSPGT